MDILKHAMVPRHEVLSAKEKKEVLDKLGATEEQLPKMLSSDPVAEKIKAKPGDLVKITRTDSVAGETVYYRIVVK